MSDDEDVAQPEQEICRFREQLRDILNVLAAHSRILEKHAGAIGAIGTTLKKIQVDIASTKADIASINAAQRVQNQLTASIHQLWSRLKCVAPEDVRKGRLDVAQDADNFRRRSASSEIRQLSMVLSDRDDDDEG